MNTWITRIAAVQYAAMDKMRHPKAFEVAGQAPEGHDFCGFEQARQCLLVTFRRSGEPMASPVNFGLETGRLYLRTDASTGKVKRMRRDPQVIVIPCSLRGRPLGPGVGAIARILPTSETGSADVAIAANWSPVMKFFERALDKASQRWNIPMTYVELTPSSQHRNTVS